MTDALKILNFDGALGIQEAKSLASRLQEVLEGKFNVIINLARVESLDLSCIQIILAAKTLAHSRKLSLKLSNQLSPESLYAFYTCGLIKGLQASGKDVNKTLDDLVGGKI